MNSVYLFDIDGTLLNVDKNFMKPLMKDILSSLSIDPSITDGMKYSGRTDSAIFREMLGEKNDDIELYSTLKASYIREFTRNLRSSHISIIKGAVEAVEYLVEQGASIGLCTGNYEETANIKLKRAGIGHLFSFGAFGCKYTDRNLLPAEAEKKFIGLSGKRIDKRNFIVIGDTPKDIECAKSFGATSVAVATGDYQISELLKCDPDLALETLQSPEIWISELKSELK